MTEDEVHALRYHTTLDVMNKHRLLKGRIFDCGGPSTLRTMVQQHATVSYINGDLRGGLPSFLGGEFDAALCTEVIEHIGPAGIDEPVPDTALKLLKELRRIAKALFISTPNASCWATFHKLACENTAMIHSCHIREYTPQEMLWMLKRADWDIEWYDTLDVWNRHNTPKRCIDAFETIMHAVGYDTSFRGDCFMAVCR